MNQNYSGPPPQGSQPQGQSDQSQAPWQQHPGPAQGPYQPAGVMTPTKPKSKKTAIIASVVALALVVGGGVLAWSLLRGAAPAAAKGIPSNALAVFEVNLNPSASDKLAVKDIAEKFPVLKEQAGEVGDDYKKALWSLVEKTSPSTPDYDSEVKQWLGDSAAIAMMPSTTGRSTATPVFSFQVTNKDAAKAFAEKHAASSKVVFNDDTMVITDESIEITEDSLKSSNITTNEDYKADMGKLGDGYLATAWVSSKLVKQSFESTTGGSTASESSIVDSRLAAGIKVEDGAIALRTISWSKEGFKERGESVKDAAGSLPTDWLGSFALSIPSETMDKVWEQIEDLPASQKEKLKEAGITSADDLRAILGSQISFAMTSGESGTPQFGLKVTTKDPSKHKNLIEAIAQNAGIEGLESAVEGDTVTTTFGPNSEAFKNPSNKLSSNSEHEKLTKGIDNPQFSGWVDAQQVIKLMDGNSGQGLPTNLKQNLERISGVGMVAGQIDDHYSDSWLRIGTN